ncbi:MAG TPA: class I SAM-dependent methyltransferase [Actinomycetota bacterium]
MSDPDAVPARSLSFDAAEPLPLTGERTAPGVPEENYWFQRHVAGYLFAADRVAGTRVLDAGCGEGYGTELLAARATAVHALDLEWPVVARARARYPRTGFGAGNLVAMPFAAGTFDAVVSLQVIEHLHTPQEFLAECKRVLRPGGLILVSTPNRLTFSPEGVRNPFHTFEFAPEELHATMARHFTGIELLGTFHGPSIRSLERFMRVSFPERLIQTPAYEWPDWLQSRVARVRPGDFRVRARALERSLDLVAVARAPSSPRA